MSAHATSGLVLRDYQESAVAAAIQPNPNTWRRLLVLATGAGKTVIAPEIINRALRPGQRALFLAHREELITQARNEIEGFIPGVHVEIEQAENRASREAGIFDGQRRHVVVGSVQTMQRARLQSWARDAFALVIIDEAHHSAARSYQSLADYFGCLCEERRTPLIGVTATPQRSDKVGLGVIFQEIAASYPLPALIEQGYLCDLRAFAVDSTTDLRHVRIRAGDFAQGELENAVDNDERNMLILAAYRKYASGRPTIVFAAGVGHAIRLAEIFAASGVSAEAVFGAMGEDERRSALSRYANGTTSVLTNYAVLTEGFNAPATSCIILARPSKSSLVIAQMVGRGSRLAPGKEDCLIIDVRDVVGGKDLFTCASLAGLPANFNAKGEDVFKAKERLDELERLDPSLAAQSLTPGEVEENIALATEQIRVRELELFQREQRRKAQAEAWEARSKYERERAAEINARPAPRYESSYMWYRAKDGIEVSPDAGKTKYAVFPKGSAFVAIVREDGGPTKILGTYHDIGSATRSADKDIGARFSNTTLIRKGAPWTREEASPKQIAALLKCGIRIDGRITKGEAASRLNSAFATRSHRAVLSVAA